jgi:hypothetical protein
MAMPEKVSTPAMACMLHQLRERGSSSKYAAIFTDDLRCRHGVNCSSKTCRFHHRDAPSTPATLANSSNVPSLDALCRRASLGKDAKAPAPRHLFLVVSDLIMLCEATPVELRSELERTVAGCDCAGLLGLDALKGVLIREGVDVEVLVKLQGLRAMRLGMLQYHLQQLQCCHGHHGHSPDSPEEHSEGVARPVDACLAESILSRGSSYWMLHGPIAEALELEQWKWSLRFHWALELPLFLSPMRITAEDAWLLASVALAWGPSAWGNAFEEQALRHVYPNSAELRSRLHECRRSGQGSRCPSPRP